MNSYTKDGLKLDNGRGSDYTSFIDKTFSWSEKSVVLFGDSISAGYASGTVDSNWKAWNNIVKDKLGFTLDNRAVPSTTITNVDNNSISAKILAYSGTPDAVIVAGGINDVNQNRPIGENGDTSDTTFYGALYAICEKLKTLNCKVVFITPINTTANYKDYVKPFRNAIHEVVRPYGFEVIEGSEFGFPTETGTYQDKIIKDGLHPTQAGHSMYAKEVISRII